MDVLEESLRQVERIIDGQLAAIQRQGEAAIQLVRLGLAAMAGEIAGLGIVASIGLEASVVAKACLAAAFLLLTAATAFVAGIALGGRDPGEGVLGPGTSALRDQLRDASWSARELALSLVREGDLAAEFNSDVLATWTRHRRRGHISLVAGAAMALVGFGFIAGGSMV